FFRDGKVEEYGADRVVVCSGALGSTQVLLSSGIKQRGTVGTRFHVLGGVLVTALMDDAINGFDGIGLTCVARDGGNYVLESFFAPPGSFAVTLGGWFATHIERMKQYKQFAQA